MSSEKDKKKLTPGKFVDLDEIVKDWAWKQFELTRSHNKNEKDVRYDDVQIHVEWKDVTFTQSPPEYDNDKLNQIPQTNTLFKTTFENLTDEEQSYTFQTNRSTRSTCELELSRAHTVGGEVSVKIQVPGSVFEANAGFKSELQVSRTTRQVIENELSWGVDTAIRVKPHHRAFVEARIIEKRHSSHFHITTLLTGRVRALITNMKDNNSLLRASAVPVQNVFKNAQKGGLDLTANGIILEDTVVHLSTEGNAAFRFGSEQKVIVHQEPLES